MIQTKAATKSKERKSIYALKVDMIAYCSFKNKHKQRQGAAQQLAFTKMDGVKKGGKDKANLHFFRKSEHPETALFFRTIAFIQ